jgi:hypothetical protein
MNYVRLMWVICVLVTFILTFLCAILYNKGSDDDRVCGAFLWVVGMVIIWLFAGVSISVRSVTESIKPQVVLTETAAIIEYQGERWTYTDAKSYNLVSKSICKFELVKKYNMYGFGTRSIKIIKE